MQLSHKQKTFSEFVSTFLKFRLKFQDFQKKDDHPSWCISLNYALRKTCKGDQTFLKSEPHHVSPNY